MNMTADFCASFVPSKGVPSTSALVKGEMVVCAALNLLHASHPIPFSKLPSGHVMDSVPLPCTGAHLIIPGMYAWPTQIPQRAPGTVIMKAADPLVPSMLSPWLAQGHPCVALGKMELTFAVSMPQDARSPFVARHFTRAVLPLTISPHGSFRALQTGIPQSGWLSHLAGLQPSNLSFVLRVAERKGSAHALVDADSPI